MRTILRAFCIIAVILVMAAAAHPANLDQVSADDYYKLVTKLKNNDVKIDFLALRLAYTKTGDYKPYGGDNKAKDAAFDALNKKNFTEAVKLAQSVFETNYTDLDVHLLCRIAYREMGNAEQYAFHNSVLGGLVGSIYASGDGTSPEKAMVVISVPEEYFIVTANGLRSIKTGTFAGNGHDYDGMDVENKKTGEKKTVYFNIDIPRRWLKDKLQPK